MLNDNLNILHICNFFYVFCREIDREENQRRPQTLTIYWIDEQSKQHSKSISVPKSIPFDRKNINNWFFGQF